eukprot:gene7448-5246_t
MKRKGGQKKGLSLEEKVEKVEKWFHQHPTPYVLKELLACIPRATGVIFQSIPEVLELLVSEYRVCEERVGVHTFYWWFPLTEVQQQNIAAGGGGTVQKPAAPAVVSAETFATSGRLELQEEEERLQSKLRALEQQAEALDAGLGYASPREKAEVLEALDKVSARRTALLVAQQAYLADQRRQQRRAGGGWACGTTTIPLNRRLCNLLQQRTREALEAANRWTENYLLLQDDVLSRRPGMFTARELRHMVGVGAPREANRGSNEEDDDIEFLTADEITAWCSGAAVGHEAEAAVASAARPLLSTATVVWAETSGRAAAPIPASILLTSPQGSVVGMHPQSCELQHPADALGCTSAPTESSPSPLLGSNSQGRSNATVAGVTIPSPPVPTPPPRMAGRKRKSQAEVSDSAAAHEKDVREKDSNKDLLAGAADVSPQPLSASAAAAPTSPNRRATVVGATPVVNMFASSGPADASDAGGTMMADVTAKEEEETVAAARGGSQVAGGAGGAVAQKTGTEEGANAMTSGNGFYGCFDKEIQTAMKDQATKHTLKEGARHKHIRIIPSLFIPPHFICAMTASLKTHTRTKQEVKNCIMEPMKICYEFEEKKEKKEKKLVREEVDPMLMKQHSIKRRAERSLDVAYLNSTFFSFSLLFSLFKSHHLSLPPSLFDCYRCMASPSPPSPDPTANEEVKVALRTRSRLRTYFIAALVLLVLAAIAVMYNTQREQDNQAEVTGVPKMVLIVASELSFPALTMARSSEKAPFINELTATGGSFGRLNARYTTGGSPLVKLLTGNEGTSALTLQGEESFLRRLKTAGFKPAIVAPSSYFSATAASAPGACPRIGILDTECVGDACPLHNQDAYCNADFKYATCEGMSQLYAGDVFRGFTQAAESGADVIYIQSEGIPNDGYTPINRPVSNMLERFSYMNLLDSAIGEIALALSQRTSTTNENWLIVLTSEGLNRYNEAPLFISAYSRGMIVQLNPIPATARTVDMFPTVLRWFGLSEGTASDMGICCNGIQIKNCEAVKYIYILINLLPMVICLVGPLGSCV